MSHWPSLRPLASATLSILDSHRAPLRYPVIALCHGDPAALCLQDLHVFIDKVDVGVDQLKALSLSLGGDYVVQLTSSLSSTPPAFQLCPGEEWGSWQETLLDLPQLCHQGQLSLTHVTRANSSALP